MKRFIGMTAIFAAAALAVTVLLCVGIDPYNVFHAAKLRDNGVEPNSNYIKMDYVLSDPDRFDALLFGSSRVGAIHVENFSDVRCYNMTYSLGLPADHLENLRTLIAHGVMPKRIYLGLDSLSYTYTAEARSEEAQRCRYEILVSDPAVFAKLYLNPTTAVSSLETSADYARGKLPSPINSVDTYYRYGWRFGYDLVSDYDFAAAPPVIGEAENMEQALEDIKGIAQLCQGAGIELTVFVNPVYYVTFEASLEQDYYGFLRGLAEITDYYNFSGSNAVTTDPGNYIDPSHYNARVGDMMTAAMQNEPVDPALLAEGFGMRVTQANVEELIEILDAYDK